MLAETITADVDGARPHSWPIWPQPASIMDGVTAGLLRDGVKSFADAFGQLMDGLAKKAATLAAA